MRDLRPIYRALQLIEEQLREDINIAEMAGISGYSLYHFVRTFDQAVRHSPYNYLIRRRLSEAAKELIQGDRRLIDIAVKYCFGCPETFTRAFKRMFGILPSQLREHGVLPYQILPPLTFSYLEYINRLDFQKPALMEYSNSRWIRPRTLTVKSVAGQQWFGAGQGVERVEVPCFTFQENENDVALHPHPAVVPACFSLADIPIPWTMTWINSEKMLTEGTYAWVQSTDLQDSLPMTIAYLCHTWLPKTSFKPIAPLEIYINDQPTGMEQSNHRYHVLLRLIPGNDINLDAHC